MKRAKSKKFSARLNPRNTPKKFWKRSTRDFLSRGQPEPSSFVLLPGCALTDRFLPRADGFRPGISTPTELNEEFKSAAPRLCLPWAVSLAFGNCATASFTKYMRV